MTAEIKYCSSCRHFLPNTDHGGAARIKFGCCGVFLEKITDSSNIYQNIDHQFDKRSEKPEPMYCTVARLQQFCGPEGKKWEVADTAEGKAND